MALLTLVIVVGALSTVTGYSYNYHYLEEICAPGASGSLTLNLSDSNSVSKYGFVRVVRQGGYPGHMDCSLAVIAPKNHYLTVRIRRLDIYRKSGCGPYYESDSDYLEVRGYNTSLYYCGSGTPSRSITSLTTRLTFRLYSYPRETSHSRIGFDLYYTAFHRNGCNESEFQCKWENRCVPQEVKCDDYDNCGDWSDEKSSTCGLSTGSIVGITIVCVLAGGTCLAFGAFYFYSGNRRKKTRADSEVDDVQVTSVTPPEAISTTVSFTAASSVPTNSQYGVGVEPPPAYTFSSENVYEKIGPGFDNSLAGQGQLGPYYSQLGTPNIPPPAYENPAYQSNGEISTVDAIGASANPTAASANPTTASANPTAASAEDASSATTISCSSAAAVAPVETPERTSEDVS